MRAPGKRPLREGLQRDPRGSGLRVAGLLAALLLLGLGPAVAARAGEDGPIGAWCPTGPGAGEGARCSTGQFCQRPTGTCSEAALPAVCVRIPELCTHNYSPVCGCDGKTYGNDCARRAKGVQKSHDGECEVKSREGP